MKVTVLGCGLIGASWAALFAAYGRQVLAWDPAADSRSSFLSRVNDATEQLRTLGAACTGTVTVCDTLEASLNDTDWVQENTPENVALKLELYHRIEKEITADAIIATSTSSFTWSQLAKELTHAKRFVVAHPFNPPHLIPLVELFCPDAEVLKQAVAFFQAADRVPVCMKAEATGHIGNRLASALWREAVHIVAEGIAEVEDVDKVLIHGPGLRWSVLGTHMGYHLGGGTGGIEHYLQHLGPSQERRWASLGSPALTPEVCERLIRGVHKEAAGRSITQLEQQRDEQLMQIVKIRRAHPTIDNKPE